MPGATPAPPAPSYSPADLKAAVVNRFIVPLQGESGIFHGLQLMLDDTGLRFQNRERKGRKKKLKDIFTPLDGPCLLPTVIQVRRGVNPRGTLGSPVLSTSSSRVEWVPSGVPEITP